MSLLWLKKWKEGDNNGICKQIKAKKGIDNHFAFERLGEIYDITGKITDPNEYIKYKKVNVLYYGDEFAIVKTGESLKIKDEVDWVVPHLRKTYPEINFMEILPSCNDKISIGCTSDC